MRPYPPDAAPMPAPTVALPTTPHEAAARALLALATAQDEHEPPVRLGVLRGEAARAVATLMGRLPLGSDERRRAFDQIAYLRSYAGGMTSSTIRAWAAGWRGVAVTAPATISAILAAFPADPVADVLATVAWEAAVEVVALGHFATWPDGAASFALDAYPGFYERAGHLLARPPTAAEATAIEACIRAHLSAGADHGCLYGASTIGRCGEPTAAGTTRCPRHPQRYG